MNAQMIIDIFCVVLTITAFWSFRADIQRNHATREILYRLERLESNLDDLKKQFEESEKA